MSRDMDPYAKSNPIFWFPAPHCLFTMILLGGLEEDLRVFTGETANAKVKSSENFLSPNPILVVFRAGVRWYKKFRFLLQKAHPCPNPRRLSHFPWRSVEGFDLQACCWKKQKVTEPPRNDVSPLTQGFCTLVQPVMCNSWHVIYLQFITYLKFIS